MKVSTSKIVKRINIPYNERVTMHKVQVLWNGKKFEDVFVSNDRQSALESLDSHREDDKENEYRIISTTKCFQY